MKRRSILGMLAGLPVIGSSVTKVAKELAPITECPPCPTVNPNAYSGQIFSGDHCRLIMINHYKDGTVQILGMEDEYPIYLDSYQMENGVITGMDVIGGGSELTFDDAHTFEVKQHPDNQDLFDKYFTFDYESV